MSELAEIPAVPDRVCWCRLCVDRPSDNARSGALDAVRRWGWHLAGSAGGALPPWSYTVGLWHSFGHPELVLAGLDPDGSDRALDQLGERIRSGETFVAGDMLLSPGDQHPQVFAEVHEAWFADLLEGIPDLYRVPPVPALQLVWSDPTGALPWDPAFDRRLTDQQPWLWSQPRARPDSVWAGLGD